MSRQLEINDDVRAAGRGVLDRLQSDAAYRERFATDPRAVLEEAGVPEEVMPVLAAAAESGSEVEGFAVKGSATVFCKLAIGHVAGGCTEGCGTTTQCVTDGENCARNFWYS